MSRIIKLVSENILPLKAICIVPNSSVVKITGANDAGKTAALRCIWMAVGGKKEIPDDAIREGQDKGFVELTIGEGDEIECTVRLLLTRRPDGSIKEHDIILKDAKGRVVSSPMSHIRDMLGFGRGQFDPLVFRDAKPAEQVEMLQVALGLDFSELEAEHDKQYAKRTEVNGQAKTLAAQIPEVDDDAPDAEVSVAELSEELEAAREIELSNDQRATAIENDEEKIAKGKNDVIQLNQDIAEAEEKLRVLRNKQKLCMDSLDANRKLLEHSQSKPVAEVPDIDEIKERIKNVESDNAKARAKIEAREKTEQVAELKAMSDVLTEDLAMIKQTKDKMVADAMAEFPVPGVTIEEKEILIHGHPLANQGGRTQLQFGTLLVIKSDPKFRVVTMDEGLGKLDDESLEMLGVLMDEHGFQAWLTGPYERGEGCIVISAGEVISDE